MTEGLFTIIDAGNTPGMKEGMVMSGQLDGLTPEQEEAMKEGKIICVFTPQERMVRML